MIALVEEMSQWPMSSSVRRETVLFERFQFTFKLLVPLLAFPSLLELYISLQRVYHPFLKVIIRETKTHITTSFC